MELPLDIIKSYSQTLNIDQNLITSIVIQESGGNPWAFRYEPGFKYLSFPREWASRLSLSYDSERMAQMTSWGLMQIMGGTARDLGFKEYLPSLCTPDLGIKYGCFLLKEKICKYPEMSDWISAYNAGSVIKTDGGMYRNQKYVDSVMNNYRSLTKLS